jgi:hypothetical protein
LKYRGAKGDAAYEERVGFPPWCRFAQGGNPDVDHQAIKDHARHVLEETVQFGLGHDRNPRDQQITSALPLRGEIGQLGLNRPGLVR